MQYPIHTVSFRVLQLKRSVTSPPCEYKKGVTALVFVFGDAVLFIHLFQRGGRCRSFRPPLWWLIFLLSASHRHIRPTRTQVFLLLANHRHIRPTRTTDFYGVSPPDKPIISSLPDIDKRITEGFQLHYAMIKSFELSLIPASGTMISPSRYGTMKSPNPV